MNKTINLTQPFEVLSGLIRCESVTPDTATAFDWLEHYLPKMNFQLHRLKFSDDNTPDVENMFAKLNASDNQPCLAFAGHVDVVPTGDLDLWQSPPFEPTLRDGVLFGRGAVDMKGGLACFLSAIARLQEAGEGLPNLSLVITGDEEGPAINGTAKLLEWMDEQNERMDFCLVGEPTSLERVGDNIKIGRRGSLSFSLTVEGVQGHVAYPERANNPVPVLARLIDRLSGFCDEGTDGFQPSNLEFINVEIGNKASNVIPHQGVAQGNIRFNVLWTSESLAQHIEKQAHTLAEANGVTLHFTWQPCISPAFITQPNDQVARVIEAIQAVTDQTPQLSTGGGTSDARFIHTRCPVVELGDVGTSMHQANESTPAHHLETLTQIYAEIIRRFVVKS